MILFLILFRKYEFDLLEESSLQLNFLFVANSKISLFSNSVKGLLILPFSIGTPVKPSKPEPREILIKKLSNESFR